MADSLESVELRHTGARGAFHEFKADFLNRRAGRAGWLGNRYRW